VPVVTSILLVPFHPPGHTEPMRALGDRLWLLGHAVTEFAATDGGRWQLGGPIPPALLASADGATLFRHLFLGDIEAMTRDIVDAARACGADLIVTDVMMAGGGLAAELLGLPWASVCCSPAPELDAYRRFIPEHAVAAFASGPTLDALGLPGDDERNLLGRTSPWLHLIPSTPGFAGETSMPGTVALVGPLTPMPATPPRPVDPAGRPTVVVTASTAAPETLAGAAYRQDRYLTEVSAALGGLDVHGLVTHRSDGRDPANVDFLGFTPHDELFDRATAVVTHAGWGSVSRALVRGLPLVLVPVANDQHYIADRCAELGFGIALRPEQAKAAELRAAIQAVLTEPGYRAAVTEFAEQLRPRPPLVTAAELIGSLLSAPVASARKV